MARSQKLSVLLLQLLVHRSTQQCTFGILLSSLAFASVVVLAFAITRGLASGFWGATMLILVCGLLATSIFVVMAAQAFSAYARSSRNAAYKVSRK